MTWKIFIDGEYGTTGLQIRSRIEKRGDLVCLSIPHEERHDENAREKMLKEADFAILCLPDDAAKEAVKMIGDAQTRVIDASTAHRVNEEWVFGFKELEKGHEEKIKNARLVANPGCYSTGAIALVRPLTQSGMLGKDALININGVSGYSGGGKNLIKEMENSDAKIPYFAYATGLGHKHVPEITKYSLLENDPVFTPAVGRFPQGMIVQVPLHIAQLKAKGKEDVYQVMKEHYSGCENVRVVGVEECEQVSRLDPTEIVGEDDMDIYVFGNDEQVNLVAVLDNLGKGASGACVQALDLMMRD